jgi:hypothetical protein
MKRRVQWMLGLAMFALAVAMPQAQARGMGRMNGVVTDEGGAPIPGVTVTTKTGEGAALDVKSDDGGRWIIGGVGKGDWVVVFSKEGFVARQVKVVLEKELERTEPIKIVLKRG